MYVILFSTLRYDTSLGTIVLAVAFFLSSIFMTLNYMFKPIAYFPTRSILFVNLIQKILIPLFLLMPGFNVYLVAAPSIYLLGRVAELFLNTSRYTGGVKGQKQKYYFYVICLVIVALFFGILIVV